MLFAIIGFCIKIKFVSAPIDNFQILYDGNLHWVCSMIDNLEQVSLYDSLFYNKTSEQLDIQLALLYHNKVQLCNRKGSMIVGVLL